MSSDTSYTISGSLSRAFSKLSTSSCEESIEGSMSPSSQSLIAGSSASNRSSRANGINNTPTQPRYLTRSQSMRDAGLSSTSMSPSCSVSQIAIPGAKGKRTTSTLRPKRATTTPVSTSDLSSGIVASQAAELAHLKDEISALKQENEKLSVFYDNAQLGNAETNEKLSSQEKRLELAKTSLECPICMAIFNRPYFVSCGHTVCVSCLQSWFASIEETEPRGPLLHVNTCPICRTNCLVPTPAYIVQELINQLELIPSPPPSFDSVSSMTARFVATGKGDPGEVAWEGFFAEELETCEACGGLGRDGKCLGYAGVHGIDTIVPVIDGAHA